jgi:hypothetical protein
MDAHFFNFSAVKRAWLQKNPFDENFEERLDAATPTPTQREGFTCPPLDSLVEDWEFRLASEAQLLGVRYNASSGRWAGEFLVGDLAVFSVGEAFATARDAAAAVDRATAAVYGCAFNTGDTRLVMPFPRVRVDWRDDAAVLRALLENKLGVLKTFL